MSFLSETRYSYFLLKSTLDYFRSTFKFFTFKFCSYFIYFMELVNISCMANYLIISCECCMTPQEGVKFSIIGAWSLTLSHLYCLGYFLLYLISSSLLMLSHFIPTHFAHSFRISPSNSFCFRFISCVERSWISLYKSGVKASFSGRIKPLHIFCMIETFDHNFLF